MFSLEPRCQGQRTHGAGVAFTLDEIALPVTGELPILDLRRAHMDAEHVRDLPAPVLPLAARQAFVVGMAQAGDQLAAKLAHGLGVDAVVDGLV